MQSLANSLTTISIDQCIHLFIKLAEPHVLIDEFIYNVCNFINPPDAGTSFTSTPNFVLCTFYFYLPLSLILKPRVLKIESPAIKGIKLRNINGMKTIIYLIIYLPINFQDFLDN